MDLREVLRPRVERGAALLDSTEPYWWKRIEDELDMSSCRSCVLGQVFGRFFLGVDRCVPAGSGQEAEDLWAFGHGFDLDPGTLRGCSAKPSRETPWRDLEELWLEAIAERKAR